MTIKITAPETLMKIPKAETIWKVMVKPAMEKLEMMKVTQVILKKIHLLKKKLKVKTIPQKKKHIR